MAEPVATGMNLKDAVAAIVAAIVLLVPAVKWLIHDWSKKSRELDEEREASKARSLSRFEKDITDFRSTIDRVETSMRELSTKFVQSHSDITLLQERFADVKNLLQHYSENFDKTLGNRIRTEIIQLTKEARLITAKKDGK